MWLKFAQHLDGNLMSVTVIQHEQCQVSETEAAKFNLAILLFRPFLTVTWQNVFHWEHFQRKPSTVFSAKG